MNRRSFIGSMAAWFVARKLPAAPPIPASPPFIPGKILTRPAATAEPLYFEINGQTVFPLYLGAGGLPSKMLRFRWIGEGSPPREWIEPYQDARWFTETVVTL